MSTTLGKYEKALAFEILINREYKTLDDVIFNSKIIMDIGGHFGFFSLYILLIKADFYSESKLDNLDNLEKFIQNLKIDGDFKIHFFEPIKEYFNSAKLLLNTHKENIVFNNSGILDKTGSFDMFLSKISSQSSLYKSFLNNGEQSTSCNFIELDQYFKTYNIEMVDLLKMDIEGAEFDVLLNLDDGAYFKIRTLFIEYHILDDECKAKFNKLLKKLRTIYNSIQVIESKYDKKLGYLFCK